MNRKEYHWSLADDAILAKVVLDPTRLYERGLVDQIHGWIGGRHTAMAIRRRIARLLNMPRRTVEAMAAKGGLR